MGPVGRRCVGGPFASPSTLVKRCSFGPSSRLVSAKSSCKSRSLCTHRSSRRQSSQTGPISFLWRGVSGVQVVARGHDDGRRAQFGQLGAWRQIRAPANSSTLNWPTGKSLPTLSLAAHRRPHARPFYSPYYTNSRSTGRLRPRPASGRRLMGELAPSSQRLPRPPTFEMTAEREICARRLHSRSAPNQFDDSKSRALAIDWSRSRNRA